MYFGSMLVGALKLSLVAASLALAELEELREVVGEVRSDVLSLYLLGLAVAWYLADVLQVCMAAVDSPYFEPPALMASSSVELRGFVGAPVAVMFLLFLLGALYRLQRLEVFQDVWV